MVVHQLTATRNYSTSIEIAPGAVTGSPSTLLKLLAQHQRAHIIADQRFLSSWNSVATDLASVTSPLILAGGERVKSFSTLRSVIAWLEHNSVARQSEPVVGVGGGALLDMVALAASLYRRGVTFWRVPTTLLGAIDAGIGVKSAINFFGHKNLVGMYSMPAFVLVDPLCVGTLSLRQLRSGLAEAVKLGLACDSELFECIETSHRRLLAHRFQSKEGIAMIERAVDTMLGQLQADLWEEDLVHPTDLGHSFSRTFERLMSPKPLHGEAVAIDMALCASYARAVGVCEPHHHRRIIELLDSLRLPSDSDQLDQDLLDQAFAEIVIHRDGSRLLPLPSSPGRVLTIGGKRQIMSRLVRIHRGFLRER